MFNQLVEYYTVIDCSERWRLRQDELDRGNGKQSYYSFIRVPITQCTHDIFIYFSIFQKNL